MNTETIKQSLSKIFKLSVDDENKFSITDASTGADINIEIINEITLIISRKVSSSINDNTLDKVQEVYPAIALACGAIASISQNSLWLSKISDVSQYTQPSQIETEIKNFIVMTSGIKEKFQ